MKFKRERRKITIKKVIKNPIFIVIPILIFITATTAIAGSVYYDNCSQENKSITPDLDEMTLVNIKEELKEAEDIKLDFNSFVQMEEFLEIDFLRSSYESSENDYRIQYEKTGVGYNQVNISAYILGDTSDIYYEDDKENLYSWTDGILYKTPFNLKITFISDEEQEDIGVDYLGGYEFIENYTSAQGYHVNIIKKVIENLPVENGINPYIAVFVADGICYQLDGRTTLEEVKNIVDSFTYVD